MKKFCKKIGLAALVTVVLLLLIIFLVPYNPKGYIREQIIKQSMLSAENRKPAIILVGGSNVAFGYDSKIICDSMNMDVVNFGLHAGFGLKYIIDDLSQYIKKGDVIIISPEYAHFFDKMAYGEKPLADIFYLTKGEFLNNLNDEQLRCVVYNTPAYIRANIEQLITNLLFSNKNSIYKWDSFNEYGDIVAHWSKEHTGFSNPSSGRTKRSSANYDFINYFLFKLSEMESRGATIIMYPPVIEETGYSNKQPDILFVDSIMAANGRKFICPPSDVVMPKNRFFDSEYHLNRGGAKEHSLHIVEILKKYFLAN